MPDNSNKLSRKLQNRHIQMIALGGAIGTGLFLASASAIQMTGPSIALAYLFGGLIIYIIMRALGEMTVDYPTAGSYIEYANRYIGSSGGFIAGWNGWTLFTVASMMEVTAASTLLDYWIHIPHWITCLVLLSIFGYINLVGVKYFGETEFWFSGIKVAVIIFMIVAGIWLIFTRQEINSVAKNNLHDYAHLQIFFSHGLSGFINSLVIVCLSFCGAEFVSIAAGETVDPKKSIPKAINGVVVRIILFYVLTMAIIVLMYPYQDINPKTNPFTFVFSKLGLNAAADIINLVAIIAALSALNSCIYVTSRMLYRMSANQHAPKLFGELNKRYIPKNAIFFTLLMIFIVVILNYSMPQKILIYLFAVVTVAIIIGWYIILLTHIFFRQKNKRPDYYLRLYPLSNIFVMLVLVLILFAMFKNPDMELSVSVAPIWLLILYILYLLTQKIFKPRKDHGN
jgi:L-asparagine transporter-like permease